MAVMELRHLRYFVAVAEKLSFTAAAEALGVAQPPLSQQIRDLETEIGTCLLERTTRRVSLTQAGQDFLVRAKAILYSAQDATERAHAIGCGSVGVLNVGLTGSMLAGPLGGLIYKFQETFVGVDIQIHEMSPDKQIAALKSGQTDINFLRTPPQDPDLTSELAWSEGINVVLPKGHSITTESVTLSCLKDEKFVFLRLRDSLFARHILQCCIGSRILSDDLAAGGGSRLAHQPRGGGIRRRPDHGIRGEARPCERHLPARRLADPVGGCPRPLSSAVGTDGPEFLGSDAQ